MTKRCQHCGDELLRKWQAKYCSLKCSTDANRAALVRARVLAHRAARVARLIAELNREGFEVVPRGVAPAG